MHTLYIYIYTHIFIYLNFSSNLVKARKVYSLLYLSYHFGKVAKTQQSITGLPICYLAQLSIIEIQRSHENCWQNGNIKDR